MMVAVVSSYRGHYWMGARFPRDNHLDSRSLAKLQVIVMLSR